MMKDCNIILKITYVTSMMNGLFIYAASSHKKCAKINLRIGLCHCILRVLFCSLKQEIDYVYKKIIALSKK